MASYSWTTGNNGEWNMPSNWSTGTVPNNPAADVTIDAAPVNGNYIVTIGTADTEIINSLTMNAATNLLGSNTYPYHAAYLDLEGTLAFAPGSPGRLSGSLQTFMATSSAGTATLLNAGTVDAFIQVTGSLLITGTNGFYVTDWLQAAGGVATIDTRSIAEMSGNLMFDGIFEAKGPLAEINLGGTLEGLIVNVATIEGPPLIPDGWTELLFEGPNASSGINEWNGSAYVPLETSLKEIGNRATLDVLVGRDYSTTNILTVDAGGLIDLQAGVVASAGININGGVVQGFARIASSVTNNGRLTSVGGDLIIDGDLSGTGVVTYDFEQRFGVTATTGGILEVHGVSSGQTIIMNGRDTLQLDTPAAFAGKLSAEAGDRIILKGVTSGDPTIAGDILLLTNGGSIALAETYTQTHFTAASSGGDTVLMVVPGAQPVPVASADTVSRANTIA